jgi:hypothetical protein
MNNLDNYLDSLLKAIGQANSLNDNCSPSDTDNYRSNITNILFISQDDSNIDEWSPDLNQNIGKTQSNIPKDLHEKDDRLNKLKQILTFFENK